MKFLDYVNISKNNAGEVVKLLNNNEWNRPGKPYTTDELLEDPEGYFFALTDQNQTIGTARLKKVQWYQWELGSISIDYKYRRQGIALSIVKKIESYVSLNRGGLLQATVDPRNTASQNLLKKCKWSKTTSFIHPYYKKPYKVWNKSIPSSLGVE